MSNRFAGLVTKDREPVVLHKYKPKDEDLRNPKAVKQALHTGGQFQTVKKFTGGLNKKSAVGLLMASSSQTPEQVPPAIPRDSPFPGAQPWDGPISNNVPENVVPMPVVGILSRIARLPFFSFKDGNLSQATSLLVKATIPSAYNWRPITGLPVQRAKDYVGAYVRTAYLGIWDNKPAEMAHNKVLKAAVLLGVARAIVTTYYQISIGDLIPEETSDAIYTATHVGGGNYAFNLVAGLSENIMAHVNDAIEFDTAINDAIHSIRMSSIGLPALQGWSLMMTGHHYLIDGGSQSRKAYAMVERQFWKANNVASWWNDDMELCTDVLWHKACHPISESQKCLYATSIVVKDMILKAGVGSVAARLPAEETELRVADNYMALMQTVRSMYEAYGGGLDYSVLEYAISLARSYPYDTRLPQTDFKRADFTPGWVVDRQSALRFVAEVLNSNADVAAHAFGFYMAMTEQSALMGNTATNHTFKTSYSLNKLKNQRIAAYIEGCQAYADYAAFKGKQKREGGCART